ncbi:MAG: amidinotransferase [Flavobacteriales bacterium]|nr:amidinotransferase [Flavobacteriales bacterium]
MKQYTDTLMMVQPVNFRYNAETACNNYYQKVIEGLTDEKAQISALEEFNNLVNKLRANGISIIVVEDTKQADTPDSIFPNNWISFHSSGDVGIYPMFAENRRLERREDILETIEEKGFIINNVIDYSEAEQDDLFLEGTGSMVLDRVNEKVYASLSKRTDEDLLIEFCDDFEYTPVIFTSYQTVNGTREPIYHTNVMMAIADDYAVVCLDSIDDKKEKKAFVKSLKEDGKEIIPISEDQVNRFAGNMLQVCSSDDNKFLVMSDSAFESLHPEQIKAIERYNPIIHSSIDTIEACGGGSARCMMAEVFLPKAMSIV